MSENGNGSKFRVSSTALAQIAVWVVSIMLAYSAVNARITALEVKYDQLRADISEIKSDVKSLLRKP
jgi:hypothetical protein